MTNDRMTLVVPSFTIEWYEAGQNCTDATDADLLLIDHGTWADDAIKLGQEALTITEPDLKGFTWCAHTAVVRGTIDGLTAVSEMGFAGFERRQLYDYKHHVYAKVHFNVSDELRANAVSNDVSCQGLDYGWFEYPALITDGLTGAKLACTWGNAIICSTHCTMVLMGLGLFPDRPASMIVPARMALWFGAAHS